MATAYVNGKVYTMKQEGDTVSAFVVHDGKFLYCGDDEEAKRIVREGKRAGIFEKEEVVDLAGKCVLPGFIDDHEHLQTYALGQLKADLTGAASVRDIQEVLKERAAKTPKGKLILGTGFDHTKFADKRLPSARDLDEALPDHPVVITRYCLHVHVANTYALREAGVLSGALPDGFETDENGKATGVMNEKASAEVIRRITGGGETDYMETKEAVAEAIREANSFGITGIHPIQGAFCSLYEQTALYQDLRDEGRLTVRIYMGYDEFPGCDIRTGLGDDMVKYGFYKIFTDGSMGGRTALLTEPFADDPGNTGTCHHTQEELDALVKEAYDRHLQTAVHAIGDKAVLMTLRALKRAHDASPRPWEDIRFRLTHCSLINDEIIAMLREMPMIVDMQPGYVSTNIHWSDDRVGDRAPYLFAWKTLTDIEGLVLCGSSDAPCESRNPLVGVYAVETRSGYDGYLPEGWQPRERLTRYEALCLYTKNPAYASFEERVKGTIETGKYADFAVFEKDVFAVSAKELLSLKTEATYLGGKEVYRMSE